MTTRWKKGIGLLLAGVLLLLAGCSTGRIKDAETGGDAAAGQKGRYVETEVVLPTELQGKKINQIFVKNGKLHLLVSETQAEAEHFQEWEGADDNKTFTEVTPDWMKQFTLPPQEYFNIKILWDSQNPDTSYLYASYPNSGEEYQGHLWTATGSNLTEITPESWQELNEYNFYDYPRDMALTEGLLVGYFYDRLEFYKAADGSLARRTELSRAYLESIVAESDKYYLLASTAGGNVSGLEAYDGKDDTAAGSVPITQESTGFNHLSVAENGTILLGNADGFFRLRQEASEWEKLVGGMETAMTRLDIWCQGLAAREDDSFYAVFVNENQENTLMYYAYDPEAVNEITETLTVYTVGQSFLLQQAAVLFHKEHPNVLVEIETAVSQEDEWSGNVNYQELSQNLNTKLMAGEGADILVMDRLNQKPYLEKGLLVDINDIIAPMEANGELLENITGTYLQADGKRYMVPLGFSVTLSVGREIEPAAMQDLPSLAAMMAAEEESLLGPLTPTELLDKFLPYFSGDLVKGKELDLEGLKTNLEYLKIIAANSGILEQRSDDEPGAYNVWDLPSRARLTLEEDSGFNDALWPLAIVRLVNGSYTAFDNAFYPKLEIGINAQSDHVETAKEFIAFALSPTIQDTDYYQSYPINRQSLAHQSQADRSAAEAETSIVVGDGGEQLFEIKQYDAAEAAKLMEICGTVNRKAGVDHTIREKIAAALPGYLNGSVGLEETAEIIAGELRMYLQE